MDSTPESHSPLSVTPLSTVLMTPEEAEAEAVVRFDEAKQMKEVSVTNSAPSEIMSHFDDHVRAMGAQTTYYGKWPESSPQIFMLMDGLHRCYAAMEAEIPYIHVTLPAQLDVQKRAV